MAAAEASLITEIEATSLGVEFHQVAFGAVDQHERRTAVDRGDTADVQVGRVARTARRGRDRQTRNRTLKHVGYGRRRTVCKLRVVHRGDGSRQIDLLLGAVTYYYDVLHPHGVFCEEYLETVLRDGHRDFLGDVAQIGEAEHRIGVGNGDGETAVVPETVPRVLSPSSVTATPANGSSWESLTVPVIVRDPAGVLRAAGIRAI